MSAVRAAGATDGGGAGAVAAGDSAGRFTGRRSAKPVLNQSAPAVFNIDPAVRRGAAA